jgi:predicted small lipoprotein YifL
MKTSLARHLIAAALLAALAACGNKGPLVKASAAEAPATDVPAPEAAEPADTSMPEAAPVPPVDAPEATPPPSDVPPADDSGGNG